MKLTIGAKIALLRKQRNITQTELAEYLFLTPQTVSRWEVGCGMPETALLPKIAAFFGVSIDELFGVTSFERADDLVCKYSVLRDERSFQEAMECLNSQIQTLDAVLRNGADSAAEWEEERDKLEALKLHLWIQQGREAFQRALAAAESFVEKTEGKPEHPWYLRMRLQRNQLLAAAGKSRDALAVCQKDFAEAPNEMTLQLYFSLLNDLCHYEEILSIQETDCVVKEIIFPPAEKNLSIWWLLIHAAAEIGGTDFIERYIPSVLEVCGEQDEYEMLFCLLNVYHGEKQALIKRRLLTLLPEMSFNPHFKEKARKQIEEA